MQLMPGTWVELSARYGLGLDPFDARDNILAGTAYLKEMHDRFGSAGFLAAYHAGPWRYEQHLVTGKPFPSEATAYVAAVTPLLDNEQGEHAAAGGKRAPPWREAPRLLSGRAHRDGHFGLHSKRCNTIMTLRLSGLLLKDPRSREGFAEECDINVLMAYGRCLRPALYSSLRSSPSHPAGVSALRVTIAIANARFARKQWGAAQVNCQSRCGSFAMKRPPADVFGQALLEDPPQ